MPPPAGARTIRVVHVRRAILLFALVLGLTALAAAVSPSRTTNQTTVSPAAPLPARAVVPRTVAFEAGATTARARRVRPGEHVVISVASSQGGLATIPQLGRTGSVAPDAPALFDVLAPSSGRYDVMIQAPDSNEQRRVGTLLIRP
jgi:hypothetical protein